ncbi:MAG: hypothetical protein U0Z26_04075 [Anaerolineales bacterium]
MKKILFLLMGLSLFSAACNVSATPTVAANIPLPTQAVATPSVPTVTAEPAANAVQPAAIPTFTPAPAQQPNSQPAVIKFDAGGTYKDIVDSIPAGTSKTYSVNAMKGQIMSVSVLPQVADGGWGYVPMQIKGADGTVLCPKEPDTECQFWRGALPASQDYFVTLTPNGDVINFTMRVAINPPGKDTQLFQYHNPSTGLSITYPDSFAPVLPPFGNYKIKPELTLQLIDTSSLYKTNLGEAYIFISSSSDSQVVATCTESNQNAEGEQILGNESLNGFTFVHSSSTGAGAGNYYDQDIHRMVNNNVCYEVIFFMHSSNIGNYVDGTVKEFNRDDLMKKFNDVFSTFTIK